ncbi:MAG: hypothetical protein FJX76_15260 [Armatimonadetes bacterium]|nr:hypothetical protein [Armatimonadota bacterium]
MDNFGTRAIQMLGQVRNNQPEVEAMRGPDQERTLSYLQQLSPPMQREVLLSTAPGGGQLKPSQDSVHLSREAREALTRH